MADKEKQKRGSLMRRQRLTHICTYIHTLEYICIYYIFMYIKYLRRHKFIE